jgi:hypothetical protein
MRFINPPRFTSISTRTLSLDMYAISVPENNALNMSAIIVIIIQGVMVVDCKY